MRLQQFDLSNCRVFLFEHGVTRVRSEFGSQQLVSSLQTGTASADRPKLFQFRSRCAVEGFIPVRNRLDSVYTRKRFHRKQNHTQHQDMREELKTHFMADDTTGWKNIRIEQQISGRNVELRYPDHAAGSAGARKSLPRFSFPKARRIAPTTMTTASKPPRAHRYPTRSRSAYSMVLVGEANKIP